MTDQRHNLLDGRQLDVLAKALHQGSAEASAALATWIGKPSVVEIDSLEQHPLEEATGLLATDGEPLCFCSTEIEGVLSGGLILAFDDASGFALADLLLDLPQPTTEEWTEIALSATMETANILCCAYLNALSRILPRSADAQELLPTPPKFSRDYAESLLEFVFMEQAIASDHVILARTTFEIDGAPVNWHLLFVPTAESVSRLAGLLPADEVDG